MTIREFLKTRVPVGEIVVFRENYWQIGMTRIDNDDLYLKSLSPKLLDEYELDYSTHEKYEWATVDVLVVNAKHIDGGDL